MTPEEKKEYNKLYYLNNREKMLSRQKVYYEQNREKCLSATKKYVRENKEKVQSYKKSYYSDNKEIIKEQERNRHAVKFKTKEGRSQTLANSYRFADMEDNRGECTISREWIINNIFNSECIYCGDANWRHLGCDRINDNLPHTPENVVCSCAVCNVERYYKRMSISEFVEYRKTHPRELKREKLEEIVDINGIKIIKKRQP